MSSKEDYVLPNSQPVVSLDCKDAFLALTEQEKNYSHYLSQASWIGGLIVLFQTSPESPWIFTLLHKLFRREPLAELKTKALTKISEDDFKAILVYSCGFFANAGNYKGFGDTKFIPNLSAENFEFVVKESEAYNKEPKEVGELWEKCKGPMYSISDTVVSLGFPGKGVTTYFSSNCTTEDVQLISDFLKEIRMEAYNTRAFKILSPENGNITYEIRLASGEEGLVESKTFRGQTFEIRRGDYNLLLSYLNVYLTKAGLYASNECEKSMLKKYSDSFVTGSLDDHKDGSRHWIANKGPIVETYIGFIETYRDPHGSRAEFEGFVAVVNKAMSATFARLVADAEQLLTRLPWPPQFEKDAFLKPDFTSLDVLTFAGSGIPCGINIPNYEEIRQNEGFKNVSLGNVIPSGFKESPLPFLSTEDRELVLKYAVKAFEVQVGLHELLGHGSGKMFNEIDGKLDFDPKSTIDPISGSPVTSWYKDGESYNSIFSTLSSSYEECRAECVGLYLSLFPDVVKIFISDESEIENITYVNWLLMLVSGVEKALEMYNPTNKAWLQAHCQARFVICRVLLEAGDELVTVTESEKGEKLRINLKRDKLQTIGAETIKQFLTKLQVYKATANIKAATELYDKYSEVSNNGVHPWEEWRSIVLKHKQPRKIFVQHNTVKQEDDSVALLSYEPTLEGCIQSWIQRFSKDEFIYTALTSTAAKDEHLFQYV